MKSIRNALNAAAETLSVKTPSSSSSSSSPHDLRGKVVSVGAMRIKCGDAIADGGMATVYRGRVLDDPGNNIRDVAVKQMLLPHDSSVSELDARREVELHARLSHHECVVAQLAHAPGAVGAHRGPQLLDLEFERVDPTQPRLRLDAAVCPFVKAARHK